ncbi:hypothetical protein NBEOAGPD_1086 [Methylobacterium gregans]|uniref:Uncharacterized protein n=1 Tax=Methylobacterium gregans TaxID=374424 RepID=A0AA37HLS3_9HYPH|nr:hypothetical protein NBEOAGPD_1086 [Methylobacterium gregans]
MNGGRIEQAAAIHHHHEVGERHRLLLAVGDVDEGEAELGLDPLQLGPHPHPQERVEGRERLVEEQDLGAGDEGAGERHALLLAAGELGRHPLGEVGHLHEVEHGERPRAALGLAHAPHLQAEGDVVAAIEVGEQGVALEHHRGAALRRRGVAHRARADDHVAGGHRLVAADHPQGRGLAAARGAEQAAIGAGADLEVDAVHGNRAAVALGQADQLDIHASLPRPAQQGTGQPRAGRAGTSPSRPSAAVRPAPSGRSPAPGPGRPSRGRPARPPRRARWS